MTGPGQVGLNPGRRLSMIQGKNMQETISIPHLRGRRGPVALGLLWLLGLASGPVAGEGDQVRLRNAPPMAGNAPAAPRLDRGETGAGFLLGPIGGMGFTYRRFDEGGKGWQAGGLAYSTNDDTTVVVGGQRMWTLRSGPKSRFYALAGATHFFSKERRPVYLGPFPPGPMEPTYEDHDDSHTNIGGGLGISLGSSEGAAFVVELPLVMTFEGTDLTTVAPIPQVALLYNY